MKALSLNPFTALLGLSIHSLLTVAIPSSAHVLGGEVPPILFRDIHSVDPEALSLVRREPLGIAQVFGDLLPRAPGPSCAKCTHAFCDQPTKNFRDQTNCKCGPCKNNKNKPDPQTNDRCIPDCQGKQAANGPKDASGDATCQDCPAGQKPDVDHSDCVKLDCPDGQVPDGTKKPDGTPNCKKCGNGEKPDPTGEKCVKNDCPTGQVPDSPPKPDGSQNCKKCGTGEKPDPTGEKCVKDDDNEKCPPGQKKAPGTKRDAKCVNDKEQKDGKMKEELGREQKAFDQRKTDRENDRKRKRIGKCLPIGALALTTLSFFMASGWFMPQFMEELNLPDFWPSDIPTVPMDVPLELDPDGYNKQWMDMARYQTMIEMMGACMANPYSCPTKRLENGTEVFDYEAMQPREVVKREIVDYIIIPYGQELSHIEKRQGPIGAVVEVILAFLGRATGALRALGGAALSRLGQVASDGIKLAARTAKDWAKKEVKDEMQKGAKQIADPKQNKWFKDCLKGNNLPPAASGK